MSTGADWLLVIGGVVTELGQVVVKARIAGGQYDPDESNNVAGYAINIVEVGILVSVDRVTVIRGCGPPCYIR